jgi:hypothetical protein
LLHRIQIIGHLAVSSRGWPAVDASGTISVLDKSANTSLRSLEAVLARGTFFFG